MTFEDPAAYWLDSQRFIAVFKDLFGVRMVVWRGRLVMGLLLFFLLNQLWMEARSYEYPSVEQTPRKHPDCQTSSFRRRPTCSDDRVLHQLSGDGAQELIRGP